MEGQSAPRDAVEYCPMVAFVSTGDPLFALGDSRPIYEQLVAPQERQTEPPTSHHLILNEKDERVTPTILAVLDGYLR